MEKNTNDYLCPSCRTQEILDKIFSEIRFYNPETCENVYLAEYMSTLTEERAERSTRSIYKEQSSDDNDQRQQWEQERAEREQYRQLVAYAREALHDDYYVANHFCPGIILEFSDICKQGDEAILAKAREKELI